MFDRSSNLKARNTSAEFIAHWLKEKKIRWKYMSYVAFDNVTPIQ